MLAFGVIRVAGLAFLLPSLGAGLARPEHPPPVPLHIVASDGVEVGFWMSRMSSGVEATGTVFMLPGYTATAAQFMKWFAPSFTAAGFHTLAMDYRGFGLSIGPWSSSVAPNATVYQGTQVSRAASDAHEILSTLKGERVVLMGHSYGGGVAYSMINLFFPSLAGLVILDQDPKIMSDGSLPADPSYPDGQGSSDFSFESVLGQLKHFREYSQAGEEIHTIFTNSSRLLYHYPGVADGSNFLYHYPGVYRVFGRQFTAVLDAPLENQSQGGFFCYEPECLREWAYGTEFYTAINGQMVALQLWDIMAQDFTGVLKSVREQTKYPVFVYGGSNSHERLSSMIWAYNAMHNEAREGDYLLVFEDKTGVHVPWLNPEPSKGYFLGNLTAWLKSI